MAGNDESYHSIMGKLDKKRADALRQYADECDKEKEAYDRNYPIQSQSLRDHNKYMGEKKTLLPPTEFKALVDNKLKAHARELMQEQNEERKEKQENKEAADKKQTEQKEAGMDPRRLAFRQQMKEIEEKNKKDKDKGMDMG
jgi:hypothetical protein